MKQYAAFYQPEKPSNERPPVLHLRSNLNHTIDLNVADIYYIRADRLKCYIACRNKLLYVRHPMIQLQELVPDTFVRLHRSVILNPNHVLVIHNDCIEFEDHSKLIMTMKKCKWLETYMRAIPHQPTK